MPAYSQNDRLHACPWVNTLRPESICMCKRVCVILGKKTFISFPARSYCYLSSHKKGCKEVAFRTDLYVNPHWTIAYKNVPSWNVKNKLLKETKQGNSYASVVVAMRIKEWFGWRIPLSSQSSVPATEFRSTYLNIAYAAVKKSTMEGRIVLIFSSHPEVDRPRVKWTSCRQLFRPFSLVFR